MPDTTEVIPSSIKKLGTNNKKRFSQIAITVLTILAFVIVLLILLAVFKPLDFFYQKSANAPGSQTNQEEDWFADISGLPSCGDKKELFAVSPLKLTDFTGIVPLGTLAPTSHVLPTHHLYFHPRRVDPRNFNSLPVEIPVVAPTDITITEIRFTETKERPDFNDGVVHFSPCREVKALFDHFKTFSPILKKAYDEGEIIRCDEYQRSYKKFGTLTFKLCNKKVNIQVKKGEQIGTAGGGEGQMVFDFGTFDKRIPPATLANPARWLGQEQKQYTVCPLDYYTKGIKEELRSRLGTPDGKNKRTMEPVCGQANWDLPGTAQGVWILKGEKHVAHENPHLALAYDNTDPAIAVISMGNSAENKGFSWGTYNFIPQNLGLVNPHFKNIKDNKVYCFETENTYRNNSRAVVILQMPTPETLKIEKTNLSSCGTGPWQMSNYTEFNR